MVKKNKFGVVLLIIFVAIFIVLFLRPSFRYPLMSNLGMTTPSFSNDAVGTVVGRPTSMEMGMGSFSSPQMDSLSFPRQEVESIPVTGGDRMVVEDSSVSLVVENVPQATSSIIQKAEESGGYMVSSSVTNPKDNGSAAVVIRIPSEKLDEALTYFRSLAVKVVSEQLHGQDVTDQYVDIDRRIQQLEASLQKMNELLSQAVEVSDIMNITSHIQNLQGQIDQLKGQQLSLKQNADLAKMTIYLSTDELALPYAPSQPFRPEVIFKTAARSLLTSLRALAGFAIWIFVYAIIWLPLLIIGIILYLLHRRQKQKNT